MIFSSLPVTPSCQHSSPCVFTTAVASFSWLARRKSCYDSVDPQRCCKKPPPCLLLRLHLPSWPVLFLPHLHHIRHASHRLHFQASWLAPLYVASHLSHLSCFLRTTPLGFGQPVLSASISLRLSSLYFPKLCLVLVCSFLWVPRPSFH